MISKAPDVGQNVVLQFNTTPSPSSGDQPSILEISRDSNVPAGATLELTCVASRTRNANVRLHTSFKIHFLYVTFL